MRLQRLIYLLVSSDVARLSSIRDAKAEIHIVSGIGASTVVPGGNTLTIDRQAPLLCEWLVKL
jgi:hypothetical protein